jgi:hypothetical protein
VFAKKRDNRRIEVLMKGNAIESRRIIAISGSAFACSAVQGVANEKCREFEGPS